MSKKIEETGSDSKALFKITKSPFGNSSDTPLPPHESVYALAEEFSSFFKTKIQHIMDRFDGLDPLSIEEEPQEIGKPLFQFSPVCEDTVRKPQAYIKKGCTPL